ncbi:MAG TPA: ABC-F family ATP-binding cassette domain-containing protein [Propylenella sp.]|nr:ABC-F family ATP-binding cassette domain-containing protein [Propylenella sp.]
MSSAPPLLSLKDVFLTFGGAPLLAGVELNVGAGERIALVGRNGSGKSTLMKIAAGLVEPDRGERVLRQGTTIRYLPQEPDFSGFATTLAYVEAGLAPGDDPYRAQYLLSELGLTGGEARRAALARVLAPAPDVLILDEPTNHLDLPAIEWLEAELAGLRSAIVLVSHDRRFLQNLSRVTLWLDRGEVRRLDSGFGDFEAWRDEALEQEERDRHKLDRKILAELDWVRYGVTARRKRNQGRMRMLQEMRRERREQRRATASVKFSVAAAESSGKLVIEADGISKSLGGRKLVDSLSLRVARGDRLGIVGPNGIGKTTLLNIITGRAAPDSGTIRLGANLQIAALDQSRQDLDPATTLKEALTRGRGDHVIIGGQPRHVISTMKDFLFAPEQAGQPVGALSGGERGRLMLARALSQPSNFLVLDEPTNDLDLETLDLLQEMVADYSGTVILVSHDRDFLDRTVTSLLAAEGAGRWIEYAGGYSDMLAQRGARTAPEAKPRRPAADAKPTAAQPKQPTLKRKLGFREKHSLETLPGRIDELHAGIAALRQKLADPRLFGRDPAAFNKAAAELHAAEQALAAAEEEWLTLELLRETLER